MAMKDVAGANGKLTLVLPWYMGKRRLTIWGGPYAGAPDQAFAVCLRETHYKVHMTPDVRLPINDFSIPKQPPGEVMQILKKTLAAALNGETVYVGCMGGWGRTGLFLALLAKSVGKADPVTYVRETYSDRAVETEEQKQFVTMFDATQIRWWLFLQRVRAMWGGRAHA